jgi:hypothetical protein
MPETSNAVLILLVFLVPGFIASRVLTLAFPREEPSEGRMVIEAIALSCFNYGLLSWLFVLAWKEGWLDDPSVLALLAVLALFVSPVVLGFFLIWASDSPWVASLRRRFRLTHPVPKAWDYFFRQGVPCWVVATLRDGRIVAGLYGGDSFASSYPASEDIYLERLCRLSPDGKMIGLADYSLGGIIRMENVELLEFYEFNKTEESA